MALDPLALQHAVDPKAIESGFLDDDQGEELACSGLCLRPEFGRANSPAISPPRTRCFDIFCRPGDKDVISQVAHAQRPAFAQFEREVIGERIRDKFAASRKKGMWMGGWAPLGYDVKDRKLVVNDAEAVTVRMVFERFLRVGSIKIDGRIIIAYDVDGTNWKLSVADNGIGKPDGVFAQPKTGLGTGIVKALAQQLDATVETSASPEGTTVSITQATFSMKAIRAA